MPSRCCQSDPASLIINADDLGLSSAVNDAVFALMCAGRVTSATALVAAPAFQDAVARSRAFPGCSFGVHLCLTAFKPLTAAGIFSELGLLEGDGRFNGQIRAIRPSRRAVAAVAEEWTAQVAAAQSAGLAISHLDSHHHVHTVAWLLPALKHVQRRFGIRRVRVSMNLFGPAYHPGLPRRLGKFLWNLALRRVYATRTTDFFSSVTLFKDRPGRCARRSCELMAHPGNPAYAPESLLLGAPQAPDWLSSARLISYHEI